MANRFDLRPLFDARRGQPSERRAVDTVAVFAVIPAVIAGILIAGAVFLRPSDSAGRLATVMILGAVAAATVTILGVLAVYKAFGFRPVVRLADGMIGGYAGLGVGAALCAVVGGSWPLLLGPVGALAGLLLPLPPAEKP